jgi:hypothetical protein
MKENQAKGKKGGVGGLGAIMTESIIQPNKKPRK